MRDGRKTLMWTLAALMVTIGVVILVIQSRYQNADNGSNTTISISATERQKIETVVRDYLLSHPEIIPEVIERLQGKQFAEVIETNRAAIETPYEGAWAGAENGDVVLVEFFDYACPFCRASTADVKRLLSEDKNLKVVWRDFPVLGEESRQAALASLSAARQNRYQAFNDALFSQDSTDQSALIASVRSAKLNEMQTSRDLTSATLSAELDSNLELGRILGLTGTPSYIIGDQILNGAVGYEALKKAISEAREKAKSTSK